MLTLMPGLNSKPWPMNYSGYLGGILNGGRLPTHGKILDHQRMLRVGVKVLQRSKIKFQRR